MRQTTKRYPELAAFELLRTADAVLWARKGSEFIGPLERFDPPSGLRRGVGAEVELLPGKRVFVKHYVHGGVLSRLFGPRYLAIGRFVRELAAYERLRAHGLRVPTPIALLARRKGLFWTGVYLFTGPIPGLRPLEAFLRGERGALRRRILHRAGAVLRVMHEAGVVHPDLTVQNVQVDSAGRIVLLDFDRCRFSRSPIRRYHNLFRFHRSARKRRLWSNAQSERRDIAAFFAGYSAGKHKPAPFWAAAFAAYRLWEGLHACFWRKAEDHAESVGLSYNAERSPKH